MAGPEAGSCGYDQIAGGANWDLWEHMPSATLREAIMLTLDVEPSEMSRDNPDLRMAGAFMIRLRIAKARLGLDADSEVSLPRVRDLADEVGWQLNDRFPHGVAEQHSNRWPWGDYSNTLLDHIAEAVRVHWAQWDGNRRTAPKNAVVFNWLRERGVDPGPAKAIASLLRPDQLKTPGRPPKG